jgi:hypothetical protein
MNGSTTDETLGLVKSAQNAQDAIAKAITQSTGLVAYNLEAPSRKLFPVLTPLRNRIPRNTNGKGTAVNWKAITGINIGMTGPGVSEGNRGGLIGTAVAQYSVAYKGIGLEDYVTFEAEDAGKTFEDVRATAAINLLRATMIAEEGILLGGNTSFALGQTPTPTVAAVASGGAIGTGVVCSVICVALTNEGYSRSSLAGGVPQAITKTNADGSTDTFGGGSAIKSAGANVTTAANNSSITASVANVPGALGYAWYLGTVGNEKLAAITTINSVLLTAVPGTGQTAASLDGADHSTNALVYDGLMTYAANAANGGYYKSMATGAAGTGTPLTAVAGAGTIQEIEDAFRWFWDHYKLAPDEIYLSAQELVNITNKVIANGGSPLIRFNMDPTSGHVNISAGALVGTYLNKYTGKLVKLVLHPNAVAGTMMFITWDTPYPLSGVSNVFEIELRREYYQLDWPIRTRKREMGVYCDGVLKNYVPFAQGVITNIGNG